MSLVLRAALAGQMPSGKNQIGAQIVGGRLHRFPNARFERWRESAYVQLDRQRGAWTKLMTSARISVAYTPGDLLRRDVPGQIDALCHVLEFCPIHRKRSLCSKTCRLPFVLDDSLLVEWHWTRRPLDRERPGLSIEIETLDDQGATS